MRNRDDLRSCTFRVVHSSAGEVCNNYPGGKLTGSEVPNNGAALRDELRSNSWIRKLHNQP
jgi:hypothetical protein